MFPITPLKEASAILPPKLSELLDVLTEEESLCAEELRLRRGFPMTVLLPRGERTLAGGEILEEDLREVLERATRSSVHTALEQVRSGFVTIKGGHRVGLCGTAGRKDGMTVSLRYLSSLSIRVARAATGVSEKAVPHLLRNGALENTLILGPPGSGKTTMLRDMVRVLSDQHRLRVGVVDERGEIAGMWYGAPQFYVGKYTDVLDGVPKAEGLPVLLRAMNPQILAVDEITHPDDVAAVTDVVGCGAALLATAHGKSPEDLERRPVYRTMLREGIFRRVVLLEHREGRREYRIEVLR